MYLKLSFKIYGKYVDIGKKYHCHREGRVVEEEGDHHGIGEDPEDDS